MIVCAELREEVQNCDQRLSSGRAKMQEPTQRAKLAALTLACCLALVLLATVCPTEARQLRFVRQASAIARDSPTGAETLASTELPVGDSVNNDATSTSISTSSATTSKPTLSTGKPPIPAVNFTRVDELFAAVLEEAEVVAKWKKMDATLQASVGSILKMIFPHIVSMASDAKVSGNCSGAILKWILNLKNMRTWAVKMLDAIGKPSAGILEGSLTMFGNYKQCLQVRAPDEDEIEIVGGDFREYFRGQYCVLQVKPPLSQKPTFYSLNSTIESLKRSHKYYEKNVYDDLAELAMAFNFVNIRADLCVPSLCSRDDIQRVADFLMSKVEMRARVQRCDVEPQEDQSMIELHHLLWALVVVILLLLVLISTLTSMVFKMKSRTSKSKTRSIFTSMSVYRSLAHMKNVQMDRISDSKPVFLYPLRIIILLWIFLVSLTSQLNFQYLRELLGLRQLIMQWPMQLIVNSTLQFDSLILLTAFTYAYQNINANLLDLVKYNVSKYFRLMPSIMLMVALTIITPLLYASRSPVWHDFVDEPAQVCKSTGLVNLFFLQNWLPSSASICLPQTWIFCVELQLCILTLPLVYLLNKSFDSSHGHFKITSLPVLSLILLALIGCIINFLNTYNNSLPAAWFQTFPDQDDKQLYFSTHLFKTSTHLTTFAVGLLTGYLCRCQTLQTFSGRPYGRRCCDNLMWLTASALMLAILFSTHSWSLSGSSHLEAPLASATYAALAPLLWSVSMALILFQLTVPNERNQRSSLAQLLTNDVNLVRIGRLSFLAYLINPYVNQFVLAVQEQAIFSSILMLGHTFIGNLVITMSLAFLISALVELPCRRLVKKLLIGSRRQCTNLDIIARQIDSRQAPAMHDSFTGQQQQQQQQPQQPQQPPQSQQKLAYQHQGTPMIPLTK